MTEMERLDNLAADLLDTLCDHYKALETCQAQLATMHVQHAALLRRTRRLLKKAADQLAPGTAL